MNCKVFPFMTSSSCTEPPNEKRFETCRRKTEILNWTLLYLRSTWNFPFKDECANLMSSSTLGIHGFVDLIFSIKITQIILSGNKKGLFGFTFSVMTAGGYYGGKEERHGSACVPVPAVQPHFGWSFQAQPLSRSWDGTSAGEGDGKTVPNVGFLAGRLSPSSAPASPRWQALTFLWGHRSPATEQPAQCYLWPDHLGVQIVLYFLFYYFKLDICVCASCACVRASIRVRVCNRACNHDVMAKSRWLAARWNNLHRSGSSVLPRRDRALCRWGHDTARFI